MGQERALVGRFNALYERHARAVHAYFLGHTSDDPTASDLLQEAFLRVWRHRSELEVLPDDRQRYWLFCIARHLLADHYRRQAVRSVVQTMDGPTLEGFSDEGAASRLASSADTLDLDAAIAHLPGHLREVLAMTALGGMTSAEIGEALGRPAGTVRYQLLQARQALAAMLRSGCGATVRAGMVQEASG